MIFSFFSPFCCLTSGSLVKALPFVQSLCVHILGNGKIIRYAGLLLARDALIYSLQEDNGEHGLENLSLCRDLVYFFGSPLIKGDNL